MFLFLLLLSPSLFASDFRLRWSINSELDYFIETSKSFKERVEQRTKGRVKVEINLVKADQEQHDHFVDVLSGNADMGQEFVYKLKGFSPGLEIWDVPYFFKSDQHVESYIKSPEAIQNLDVLAQATNVTPLGYSFSGGFIYFYGYSPVKNLTDLKGKNLYLEPSSDEFAGFMKSAMGAVTSPAASLDNVTLDRSSFFEIIAGVADELFERSDKNQLYVTKSNHRVISRVVVISNRFLNSLPADLRKIVIEEGRSAAERERGITIRQRDKFLSEAKQRGIKLISIDENSALELVTRKKITERFMDSYMASKKVARKSAYHKVRK